jgi:hypothetical protein
MTERFLDHERPDVFRLLSFDRKLHERIRFSE